MVGFVHQMGHVVGEQRTSWVIGLASRKPIPTNVRKNARYTASTASPRGSAGAAPGYHRIQDQRDESGHHEDQQHLPSRPGDRPHCEQRHRQRHQLHPPRHHCPREPCRGRCRGRRRFARVPPLAAASAPHRPHRRSMAEPGGHRGGDEDPHAAASAAPVPGTSNGHGPSILFVGDLVGGIGRVTLLDACRCCANATHRASWWSTARTSRAAWGSPRGCRPLFAAGVDAITLGNHAYHRNEIYPYLDSEPRILRPANYLRIQPGHGPCMVERDGVRLGVVNLSGNLYLRAGRSAFTEIDGALSQLERVPITCSSTCTPRPPREGGAGLASGRARDRGGGHPHPRADRRWARASGRDGLHHRRRHDRTPRRGDRRQARAGDRVTAHQMPTRFEPTEEDPWLMGVLVRCSTTRRRADAIEPVLMPHRLGPRRRLD